MSKILEGMTHSRKVKHGDTWFHGKPSSLYTAWQGMKKRCNCPSMKSYKDYGGRGISVCQEWLDYTVFKAWALANGYAPGLEIDRRENDGNYEPRNCRFVTHKINAGNKRDSVLITVNGRTECMAEWSRLLFGNRHKLRDMVRQGANAEELIRRFPEPLRLLNEGRG